MLLVFVKERNTSGLNGLGCPEGLGAVLADARDLVFDRRIEGVRPVRWISELTDPFGPCSIEDQSNIVIRLLGFLNGHQRIYNTAEISVRFRVGEDNYGDPGHVVYLH